MSRRIAVAKVAWRWTMTDNPSEAADATDHPRARGTHRRTHDRITVRTTDEQLAAIESLVSADVYPNRSEVIRAGIDAVIERHARGDADEGE